MSTACFSKSDSGDWEKVDPRVALRQICPEEILGSVGSIDVLMDGSQKIEVMPSGDKKALVEQLGRYGWRPDQADWESDDYVVLDFIRYPS